MQSIDSSGFWHLPDASDHPVAGKLHYSVQDGITLSLLGTLRELAHGLEHITYPTIHGIIADSPYPGKLITLVNCFRKGATFTIPGFETEEIRANRAYIGTDHLLDEDQARFASVRARYAYLAEWSGLTGFRNFEPQHPTPQAVLVRYESPPPVELRIGERNARLEVDWLASTRHRRFEISEQAQLTFSDGAGFAPQQILRELIFPLADFLTFAVDQPNSVDDVIFVGQSQGADVARTSVNLLFQPVYKARDEQRPSRWDMLFTWEEVTSTHPNVLNEWLRLRSHFKIALDVYFGLLYGPPVYLETKFRLLVTVLSLFLGGRVSDQAIRDAIDGLRRSASNSADGRWIDMLPSTEELCLPQNLLALIESHSELIPPLGQNAAGVVAAMIEMNRYLFGHRITTEMRNSQQLLLMVERLILLTKVVILEHLGFVGAEIVTSVSRSKTYKYLMQQAR
jgi:hypothetical protein